MKHVIQYALAAILFLSGFARADVTLPKIFSDNMVLQQELPIAVWGKASPGETVTVTLADKSVSTKAEFIRLIVVGPGLPLLNCILT